MVVCGRAFSEVEKESGRKSKTALSASSSDLRKEYVDLEQYSGCDEEFGKVF